MAILDQYSSSKIRHPSWRVYRAIKELNNGITAKDFGLRTDIEIYMPYEDLDPLTKTLVDALSTEHYENNNIPIVDAISLFLNVQGRQYLECLLMTGMTPFDASEDTGYSVEFIQTYANVFYDNTVWRTHADKQAYLAKGITGEDQRAKQIVDKNGIDYAKARLFRVASKIKIENAILNLFSEMYKQTMKYIELDTPEDQEAAQGWAKLTIATYKELKNIDQSDGGIRELTIALQASPAPTTRIEDLTSSNEGG